MFKESIVSSSKTEMCLKGLDVFRDLVNISGWDGKAIIVVISVPLKNSVWLDGDKTNWSGM